MAVDRNGEDGDAILPPDDREFADLLIRAAAGADVEGELIALLNRRR